MNVLIQKALTDASFRNADILAENISELNSELDPWS